MMVGAERLIDNMLTFLSPFPHTFHHHFGLEIAPLRSIPISTNTKTMFPSKRRSCMPCKTNSLKKKDRQVRYQRQTNQS